MDGDDVGHAGEPADDGCEPLIRRAPGVGLVTSLDPRPLLRRHRPRAGVSQQVDEDVATPEPEQVVSDFCQRPFALGDVREVQGLDRLDPEGLDDRVPSVEMHRAPSVLLPSATSPRKPSGPPPCALTLSRLRRVALDSWPRVVHSATAASGPDSPRGLRVVRLASHTGDDLLIRPSAPPSALAITPRPRRG